MKIAIVNYRYFVSGGPERYMFNIMDVLQKEGHEVFPFSIKHKKNEFTEYEKYFVDAIGTGEEVYNSEYPTDISTRVVALQRMLYSVEVKEKFKTFLEHFKPDIIYILHFQNKLSCSVVDAAYELRIPIVQRISDFGHICPNSYLYREPVGVCNECISNGFFSAVKNKCISKSIVMSGIKALSLKIMEIRKIKTKINAFVFPSSFTMRKYISAGFDENRLHTIPTFFNFKNSKVDSKISHEDYALFVGRLEKEKGIELLIDAFIHAEKNLKIIGFGDAEFEKKLKDKISKSNKKIEFLGRKNFDEIVPYLSSCLFTCVPSLWYENLPNTVLESYAYKKAVLANNIGSLPEFVTDSTGYIFNADSKESLVNSINSAFSDKIKTIKKGENGYDLLTNVLSPQNHYNQLIALFNSTIRKFV